VGCAPQWVFTLDKAALGDEGVELGVSAGLKGSSFLVSGKDGTSSSPGFIAPEPFKVRASTCFWWWLS
jgi:hypothetical protein